MLVKEQPVFLWCNLPAMRRILVFMVMVAATSVKAQSLLPGSFQDYAYGGNYAHHMPLPDSGYQKKWSFSRYAGISAGYSFFRGGSAMTIAAPVGLQVNRRLTNNLYAFAGVSVAPAYTNFNGALLPAAFNKLNTNNSFLHSNSFGVYSRAELGLMYVNDAKTFSISGSIGVERSNYPYFYSQPHTTRQSPVASPNR